jgi:hypothetical protein
MAKTYRTFAEFWPFYLGEHRLPATRRMHFVGTSSVLAIAAVAIGTRRWPLLWLMPVVAYGLAWTSHFFVEKNRPATFTYPLWSLAADFKMWGYTVTGKRDWLRGAVPVPGVIEESANHNP